MASDLRKLPPHVPVKGVRVERALDFDLWKSCQHPYSLDTKNATVLDSIRVRHGAQERWPERVAHFFASVGGKPVGSATVSLGLGPLGTAGIFDVGVLPEFRGRFG